MEFSDNFTPVSRMLAKEVGLVCAAVYGVVWRYCQMEDGVCRASLDTLGEEISVDRATVMRAIKKLCELGYLTDQTPGRRNAPHAYILAKSVAECNSSQAKTVAESNGDGQSVAECKPTVAQSNATVAESYLNKDSKRDSKKEENAPSHAHEETPTRDPLGDIFNGQGQHSEAAGPNPQDQYFAYRDEFLNIYHEMTGDYPDTTIKTEIISLVETGNITPTAWREGWRQTKLNWTGKGKIPLSRVIDVCQKAGGDYEKWKRLTWPERANGRDSPGASPIQISGSVDKGFNL